LTKYESLEYYYGVFYDDVTAAVVIKT